MLLNFVNDFRRAQAILPEGVVIGANPIVESHGFGSGLSFKATRSYVGTISLNDLLRSIALIISWAFRPTSSLLRTRHRMMSDHY